MPRNWFNERIGQTYEAKWPELFEPAVVDPAVRLLADLAGTGAALEPGIGTGRIAMPLRRRGVHVHGIDLSPDMVAQLKAKPGSDDIGVTVGDFATTRVGLAPRLGGRRPARDPRGAASRRLAVRAGPRWRGWPA